MAPIKKLIKEKKEKNPIPVQLKGAQSHRRRVHRSCSANQPAPAGIYNGCPPSHLYVGIAGPLFQADS